MRRAFAPVCVLAAAVTPALAASAIDSVITETVDFARPNGNATNVARQMYGSEFPSVLAERVWLTKKSDGYDQMLVRLGKDRDCTGGCFVAALYYDGKQWLEIWRRPGKSVGLGPVGPAGLKPLSDGHHIWRWYDKAYIEAVNSQAQHPRAPSGDELKATVKALNTEFGPGPKLAAPADVSAVDIDLKDGNGSAMLVSSTYYCGNSACPVVILDGASHVLATLYSLGPDIATVPEKDKAGRHFVEVTVPGGVATWSVSDGRQVSVTKPMEITIAGDRR
ncbi:MAG TPA: hypothetical protein VFJ18_11215 [Pararhizobium sp.]|nr:hypothetical protein [Pararhizobium sp.]